jgi:hypothetical protein
VIEADFVLRHARPLLTLRGAVPRLGAALRELAPLAHGALAARSGRIVWVGNDDD